MKKGTPRGALFAFWGFESVDYLYSLGTTASSCWQISQQPASPSGHLLWDNLQNCFKESKA